MEVDEQGQGEEEDWNVDIDLTSPGIQNHSLPSIFDANGNDVTVTVMSGLDEDFMTFSATDLKLTIDDTKVIASDLREHTL